MLIPLLLSSQPHRRDLGSFIMLILNVLLFLFSDLPESEFLDSVVNPYGWTAPLK